MTDPDVVIARDKALVDIIGMLNPLATVGEATHGYHVEIALALQHLRNALMLNRTAGE